MQEVIINIGVSGSGKSTWSTDFIKKNPNYVRVNRDDIRKTLRGDLDGYYKQDKKVLEGLELFINQIEESMAIQALFRGYSLIIDNTNLKEAYIKRWVYLARDYNEPQDNIPIKFKIFRESDPKILKKRVDVRDAIIDPKGLDYIDKQVVSLKSIISYVENNFKNQIIND